MSGETDWTKAAGDIFLRICRERRYVGRWQKIGDPMKRGVPDVWAYANARASMARSTFWGPGAWIEFKKGRGWPTPVQAAHLFSLASEKCPCYLIRMLTRERMELYTPHENAGEKMHAHDAPYRDLYTLEKSDAWEPVLACLATRMATH